MAFFHNTPQIHIQNFSNYYSDHHHQNNAFLVDHSTVPIVDNFRLENKIIQKKCERGTKRKRNEPKEGDNSENVIQVRAKRGQATDRHSLAERVRRKKINERLKCLQTLVPGCYETMGMAVMLDAVISYVQSLQNQIEFLSTKLSTASMHYDFHAPSTNVINTITQATNPTHHLVQDIDEKIEREGFGGYFHFH